MNTPLQEKLRWESKKAEQLKVELIQVEIDLMRAYPDLEQATKQRTK